MNRKPSWKPNLGARMFDFIQPTPYEPEERPPAPRPRPEEDGRPYGGQEYRPRLPFREEGRSMIVAPPSYGASRRESGMFDWVQRSSRYVPPPSGRDEDMYTEEDLRSIPSIDGWRRRGASMGAAGSSSGWLLGVSVAVGFGIAAALAYFSMPGQQQPKA